MVDQTQDISKYIDKNIVAFQNGAESFLEYPLTVLDSTVTLQDGLKFPLSNGVLRIGNELIFYKTRNGNVCKDIKRGYSGTSVCSHPYMAKVIGPCISDTINTPRDFIFAIEKFIGLQSDIYKQEDQSHSLFSKISYIRSRWGRVNANFLASKRSGTAPLTVQFKDISTGSPIGWKWDFGDGIVSFEKDPIHTYEKPGTYDVSLVAHAGSNSSILKSQYIYAFTEDVINNVVFYVKQIVDGKETNSLTGKRGAQFKFVCQSDGPIVSRFWDFGDGSQPVYTDDPTKIEIQYTYNYTGKFYPVLTVSDSGKTCKKQLEHPIIITKN